MLLAEDNAQVREFAAQLLRDLDCEVATAEDGTEALEQALTEDFDLVFSDVVMPGLSGLQLARRLEAERPDLPVLLAAGFSEELRGEPSRGFAVVAKPYDATSLGNAMAVLLVARRGRAA